MRWTNDAYVSTPHRGRQSQRAASPIPSPSSTTPIPTRRSPSSPPASARAKPSATRPSLAHADYLEVPAGRQQAGGCRPNAWRGGSALDWRLSGAAALVLELTLHAEMLRLNGQPEGRNPTRCSVPGRSRYGKEMRQDRTSTRSGRRGRRRRGGERHASRKGGDLSKLLIDPHQCACGDRNLRSKLAKYDFAPSPHKFRCHFYPFFWLVIQISNNKNDHN